MKNSRVFISHSQKDITLARRIKAALENNQIEVVSDEFIIGGDFTSQISQKVRSSDYFIILLSDFTNNNKWIKYEINEILEEFYLRNVSIIPVLVSDSKIPYRLNGLKSFKYYENESIQDIIGYLKNIVYLDFKKLNEKKFYNLVVDLLIKSNFKVIQEDYKQSYDYGFDIKVSLTTKNQLVGRVTTNWLVDCKLYGNSRVDISSIEKMGNILLNEYQGYNGMLITNSLLTSTAHETLEIIKKKRNVNIEIVDGKKLKELVLKYPDIIEKHFMDEWRE